LGRYGLRHIDLGHFGFRKFSGVSVPPPPSIFLIILFVSTTLLTRMTGSYLHMQWPLTSQSHGSFLKEINCFFVTDQTPRPGFKKFYPSTHFLPKSGLTKWSPGADGRPHAADLAGGEEVAVFLQPLQDVQTRLVAVKNGLELSANLQHEQGSML
jgi:hypothetical protein